MSQREELKRIADALSAEAVQMAAAGFVPTAMRINQLSLDVAASMPGRYGRRTTAVRKPGVTQNVIVNAPQTMTSQTPDVVMNVKDTHDLSYNKAHRIEGTNLYTFMGKTMNLAEWAKEVGVSRQTMYNRVKSWPLEIALSRQRQCDGKPKHKFGAVHGMAAE